MPFARICVPQPLLVIAALAPFLRKRDAPSAKFQFGSRDRILLALEKRIAVRPAQRRPYIDKAGHEDFSRIDAIPAFVDAYGIFVHALFLSPT
jgi:hypothetical protein